METLAALHGGLKLHIKWEEQILPLFYAGLVLSAYISEYDIPLCIY